MKRVIVTLASAILAQAFFLAGAGLAHIGTGISVDPQGRVYFADTLRNRIWRIEPGGQLTLVARDLHVNVVVAQRDGSLYVVERIVWRIMPDGEKTQVFPRDARDEQSGFPMTADSDGNIYVLRRSGDHEERREIWKRTPTGELFLLAHAREAGTGFLHLTSCTPGLDGALYAKDGNTLSRIALDGSIRVLPEGTISALLGRRECSLARPLGLAADQAGNVYVANYWQRQVLRSTPAGQVSTLARTAWPWIPTGVAIAGGDLYVLERLGNPWTASSLLEFFWPADWLGNVRVRKIFADGRVTTLATVRGWTNNSAQGLAFSLVLLAVITLLAVVLRRVRRQS